MRSGNFAMPIIKQTVKFQFVSEITTKKYSGKDEKSLPLRFNGLDFLSH